MLIWLTFKGKELKTEAPKKELRQKRLYSFLEHVHRLNLTNTQPGARKQIIGHDRG